MHRVIPFARAQVVREYEGLAQRLRELDPVLDLGCGSGTLLESLHRLESRPKASPLLKTLAMDAGFSLCEIQH